jgi:ABC-type multidrug transport system fused ATPase/permease subunit
MGLCRYGERYVACASRPTSHTIARTVLGVYMRAAILLFSWIIFSSVVLAEDDATKHGQYVGTVLWAEEFCSGHMSEKPAQLRHIYASGDPAELRAFDTGISLSFVAMRAFVKSRDRISACSEVDKMFGANGFVVKNFWQPDEPKSVRVWIVEHTLSAYAFLLPLMEFATVVALCIVLPLAAFRRTRMTAGWTLYYGSFVFGITTWCFGAAVTFMTVGWIGLFVGLLILGIGVVPVGILGALYQMGLNPLSGWLVALSAITYAARFFALSLLASAGRRVAPAPPPVRIEPRF